jgi:cytochrome c55X
MLWLPNTVSAYVRRSLYKLNVLGVVIAQQLAGVRCGRIFVVVLVAGFSSIGSGAAEPQADEDAPYVAKDFVRVDKRTYAGWRAVRQFDCARCHGAQYQGLLGPSLIEAARVNTRAQFIQALLEGNRDRGMPPYREVRGVADNADGIYGYFRGRADGKIGGGMLELLR